MENTENISKDSPSYVSASALMKVTDKNEPTKERKVEMTWMTWNPWEPSEDQKTDVSSRKDEELDAIKHNSIKFELNMPRAAL